MTREMTGEEVRTNQCRRVLEFMRQHGSITHRQAEDELDIMRLAARIFDIRSRLGIEIESRPARGTNRFGEPTRWTVYSLKAEG